MTTIKALQPVNYDRRTDTIDPVGSRSKPTQHGAVTAAGYTVIEPVAGWAPFTHLIEVDTFDRHQVYLAQLAD